MRLTKQKLVEEAERELAYWSGYPKSDEYAKGRTHGAKEMVGAANRLLDTIDTVEEPKKKEVPRWFATWCAETAGILGVQHKKNIIKIVMILSRTRWGHDFMADLDGRVQTELENKYEEFVKDNCLYLIEAVTEGYEVEEEWYVKVPHMAGLYYYKENSEGKLGVTFGTDRDSSFTEKELKEQYPLLWDFREGIPKPLVGTAGTQLEADTKEEGKE